MTFLLKDSQVNAFVFGWSSYRKVPKIGMWSQITLWSFKWIHDVWKCRGPSCQICTTNNSSLDSGLETTLSLLSKASVARNTWGSLSTVAANTLLVMYILEWQSVHFAFTYVLPFFKAVSRSEIVFTQGGSPKKCD